MTIEDVLLRLRVQKRAARGRDNRCICPVHDDKTGSLMVKVDDTTGRILMCCQAGCSAEDITQALGITLADLNERPVEHQATHRARTPAPKKDGPPVKRMKEKAEEKPERKLPWPPTKVYHYTDEDGKLIFDVLRFTYPQGDKTFRQGIPDQSKASGWSLGGVSGLRKPLYQLPLVRKGIEAGRTIYVVQGEKDCETLYAMKLIGTTNPGGASKPGDKVKWLDEHTQSLAGADVVVLPDVDDTGLSDRRRVALDLLRHGCKVRFVDLRENGQVQMPPKGDVSDLAKLVGMERAQEILHRMVNAAPYCTEEDLQTDEDLRLSVIQMYMSRCPGYTIQDGSLAKYDPQKGNRTLCNFVAYPAVALTTDDGITKTGMYMIRAWSSSGKRLQDVKVPYSEFSGHMGWLDTAWPQEANVATGSTVRDNIRHVMVNGGICMGIKRTQYLHTGWRKISGKWAYLYQGGAMGADGVQVELGGKLQRYRLGDSSAQAIETAEAAAAVMELQSVMPGRVYTPCMAMVALAPLRSVMDTAGVPVRHLLYLYGRTGSGKSVTASLMLQFFGVFGADEFPASFSGSTNYIRQCAFALKDSLLVVDDYIPTRNQQQKRKIEQMAEDLSRMFGDSASRDILNSDSTRRASTPPRSLCMVTGEMLPDISESGLQRYYCVRMGVNDIPKDDRLTEVQRKGTKGYFRKWMSGYLEWLIPQMDTIGDRLNERFVEYRARAQHAIKNAHARTPGNVAHIMLGVEMMLRYQMHALGMGDDQAFLSAAMEKSWADVLENTRVQQEDVDETSPAQMFIQSLQEMIISGVASTRDLDDAESLTHDPPRGMVGYRDENYYYFLPETTYTMVCEIQRKKGLQFPGNQRSMCQRLKEESMCLPAADGKPLRGKSIGGKTKRYIWIPRVLFDGQSRVSEQMTLVDDQDNPF